MANHPRRIATAADVEQYLDYALEHGVLRVSAREEGCIVEHVCGGVANALLDAEPSQAITKLIRTRIARLQELLAKFEAPELLQ